MDWRAQGILAKSPVQDFDTPGWGGRGIAGGTQELMKGDAQRLK